MTNKTTEELKKENEELLQKRDELWQSIKDFDSTSYHKAERVGKHITQINRQIAANNRAIDSINNPIGNG